MKVAELFAYLGVIADEKKAKDFFNVLEDGKQVLFGLAAMAVGTSIGIGAMLDKALNSAIALAHFTAQTGLSAQVLQEWQHAGEAMGLSVDEVTSSVINLNKKLAEVRLGGDYGPFARLGLSVNQDAWGVMKQLRGIVQSGRLSPQMMSLLTEQLGISPAMVKVLKLTNAEFDRLANRKAIITEDQIAKAMRFNAAMKELGQTLTSLFSEAFAMLEPTFSTIVTKVKDWMDKNRKGIVAGIEEFTKNIITFGNKLVSIGAQIDSVVTKTIGWENALKGIAGMIVLFNPFLRMLTLIYSVLDLIDKFQGKGSWQEKSNKFMHGGMGPWSWLFGAGTKLGETMAPGLFSFARGETPWSEKPAGLGMSGDVFRPLTIPSESRQTIDLLNKLGELKSAAPSEISIAQSITSSASAREVAEIAVNELRRAINLASLQTQGAG